MSKTINELRKQTGMSQSKFANKFHINKRTLQSWEQGYRHAPEYVLYMIETILDMENEKEVRHA